MFKEERAFAIVAALAIAFLLAMISTQAIGAEAKRPSAYERQKAERLAAHRELRRAIERRYESCTAQCFSACAPKPRRSM